MSLEDDTNKESSAVFCLLEVVDSARDDCDMN